MSTNNVDRVRGVRGGNMAVAWPRVRDLIECWAVMLVGGRDRGFLDRREVRWFWEGFNFDSRFPPF